MSRTVLFDALVACRMFFQGPLVVQAGASSGVFLPTPRVDHDDLINNYDVPPTACNCHLLMAGICLVFALRMMYVTILRPISC